MSSDRQILEFVARCISRDFPYIIKGKGEYFPRSIVQMLVIHDLLRVDDNGRLTVDHLPPDPTFGAKVRS